MNDERGRWILESPLPDCPKGQKGSPAVMGQGWSFYSDGGYHQCYCEETMRRNPAIFRWVPEPEEKETEGPRVRHVEMWLCEDCIKGVGEECHTPGCALFLHPVGLSIAPELLVFLDEPPKCDPVPKRVEWPEASQVMREYETRVAIYCKHEGMAESTADAIRAILQALREGKAIMTMKINPPVFRKMCEAISLEDMFEVLIRPDGSRP